MQQDITSDVDPDLDPVRSAYICSVDPDPHSELDSDQRFKMKEKSDQPTIFFRRKLYFSSLNQKSIFFYDFNKMVCNQFGNFIDLDPALIVCGSCSRKFD